MAGAFVTAFRQEEGGQRVCATWYCKVFVRSRGEFGRDEVFV